MYMEINFDMYPNFSPEDLPKLTLNSVKYFINKFHVTNDLRDYKTLKYKDWPEDLKPFIYYKYFDNSVKFLDDLKERKYKKLFYDRSRSKALKIIMNYFKEKKHEINLILTDHGKYVNIDEVNVLDKLELTKKSALNSVAVDYIWEVEKYKHFKDDFGKNIERYLPFNPYDAVKVLNKALESIKDDIQNDTDDKNTNEWVTKFPMFDKFYFSFI